MIQKIVRIELLDFNEPAQREITYANVRLNFEILINEVS